MCHINFARDCLKKKKYIVFKFFSIVHEALSCHRELVSTVSSSEKFKGETWPQMARCVHVRALTRSNEVADGRESARENYKVVNGIYDLDTRHGRGT